MDELDSDASDLDYVPEDNNIELPSEEESDGDPEDDFGIAEKNRSSKKRSQNKVKRKSKKLKAVDPVDSNEPKNDKTPETPCSEEQQKKKADSLWADFLKDTNFKPKPRLPEKKKNTEAPITLKKVSEKKITVTKIFEFAGEEVKVDKEIDENSAEARLSAPATGNSSKGRGGLGGISSVLNQLGKKQKISTLEKSKLDWDRFKKEENIEEELQTYNKGKHGYLERQDFLERADLRQFEIEKEIRATHRSHKL